MVERTVHKVDPVKVKVGDYMAFTYWVKVKEVRSGDCLIVSNLDGESGDMAIRGQPLIVSSSSAEQYSEEVKVSKTAAAEILINSFNRPLTVSFQKADGQERVMKCRMIKHESLLGRSTVEDLEKPPKENVRLVDHRTLNYVVVDGVKYSVK